MASKKKAAKKTKRRASKKGGMSASDFIRTLPRTAKAADVVKAGAAKGYSFGTNLVYAVRAAAKKKKAGSKKRRTRTSQRIERRGTTPEAQYRRLIFEIGPDRARAILEDIEAGITRLIEGG